MHVIEQVAVRLSFTNCAPSKRKGIQHEHTVIVEMYEQAPFGNGFDSMGRGVIPPELWGLARGCRRPMWKAELAGFLHRLISDGVATGTSQFTGPINRRQHAIILTRLRPSIGMWRGI